MLHSICQQIWKLRMTRMKADLFQSCGKVGYTFSSREQVSCFMAAATICSDFGAPKTIKSILSPLFPHLFTINWWDQMPRSSFTEWRKVGVLSQLFHSPLSLSSRGSLVLLCFLPSGWCHLHIWGYWYFTWQSWFQLVLHPAQHFAWCTLYVS